MNEKEIIRIAKRIVAAPTIWNQSPLKIDVHSKEEDERHKALHLHVTYRNESQGSVEISSGTQLAGKLPPKALKLIREWLAKYREAVLGMIRSDHFYRLDRTVKTQKKAQQLFAGTIIAVEPIEDLQVIVAFDDGTVKLYDCKPAILKREYFEKMRNNPELFWQVQIDRFGDKIFWNDDMAFPADGMHDRGIDLI